jgi:chemotaxis signal transduction protein
MTPALQQGDDGILCCEVGHERFAFRGKDVRHVERAEYMRPDRGEDGRLGTLRLGGQNVPVFALADVLGRTVDDDPSHGRGGHIAVTADRNGLTGWLADRIERAAEPSPGDIAALPPIVGAQATSWFEGIVRLGDNASALLLAPHRLGSPFQDVDAGPAEPAFTRERPVEAAAPERAAILFSTPVFPPSTATRFALSGRQVAAIVQPTAPLAVPGCHEYVGGITWWHGAVVPVIDFRPPSNRTPCPYHRQLIAQCGSRRYGSLVAFAIDLDVRLCRPGAEHRALPDVPCPPFASGVFNVDGEAVALLDLDALLSMPLEP